MTISYTLKKVVDGCGFGSDYYLDHQINKVEQIAKDKGLDLYSSPVLIGFDVQGPAVKLTDASFQLWNNVRSAILAFDRNPNIEKSIISGWDLTSLKDFKNKRFGDLPISIIGELGAVFEYQQQIYEINPMQNTDDFYKMELNLFKTAAQEGLKLCIQGNISKNVNCFYFEGDDIERGDVKNHFLVKGTNVKTQDIYQAIKSSPFDTSDFEYTNKKIVFV